MRLLAVALLAVCTFAQTPTILNPQYLFTNPPNTDPANPSWGSYRLSADFVPPFDYEFASILIGNHDFRTNSYTPRGSWVSSSSALMIGWDTPTDAQCILFGCRINNGQAGLTVSMKVNNTFSPTVGLMLDVNPRVDNYNGIWGFNVNMSNAFHRSNAGFGLAGGEINIGLDDYAADVPNPGYPGQSIGLTITESSQNRTGKRVSTAWAMGYGGTQNFHHGLWAAANPNGQTPMDDLIHGSGPMTTVFDLSEVASGPVAIVMPSKGGFANGTVRDLSDLPPNTPAGTQYWCVLCAKNSDPCAIGSTQALAISTGGGYRCY